MSIKDILTALSDSQRSRMMIAFDSETTHVMEYSRGKFIAVHLNNPAANLTITARAGSWSIGEIRHVDSRPGA